MGHAVGKKVKINQKVHAAPAGRTGQIVSISHEPMFGVGVDGGVAYVPASYLDDPDEVNGTGQPELDNDPEGGPWEPTDNDDYGAPSPAATTSALTPGTMVTILSDWRARHRR